MLTDQRDANVIIVQPALPSYRIRYFSKLSEALAGHITVYYSGTQMGELTSDDKWPWSQEIGAKSEIFPGLYWQRGVKSIKFERNDVLFLSGNVREISNFYLALKGRRSGARIVLWGHYWSSTSKPWRHWLRTLISKFADGLLFYTDDEVEAYRQTVLGRNDHRPICALNNGIDVAGPLKLSETYRASRRENALLFIGRITAKAKLDLIIRALARIENGRPSLQVIGEGEGMVKLKLLTEELGIRDDVVWHGATTDEKEISSIANRCKAFVYPGEVGLSLIHSMAYGLPSIVHDLKSRQMPEYAAFKNGATGMSFRFEDPSSLKLTIEKCLSDHEALNAWSNNCQDTVKNTFNTDDMMHRFMKFLNCFY